MAPQKDREGNISLRPQRPKLEDWMQQGLPDVKPAGMGATPAAIAFAPARGPARAGQPVASSAVPTPEHPATAADYVKKIRDANAKGDLEGAAAFKKDAAKFIATVPGVGLPGGLPPQEDQDDEDLLDDSEDEDYEIGA